MSLLFLRKCLHKKIVYPTMGLYELMTRRLFLSLLVLVISCPPETISYDVTGSYNYNARRVSKTPVVIAPGFMNDSFDYHLPFGHPEERRGDAGLVSALEKRGFDPELIHVVPMQRRDWFRVVNGLWDRNTYKDVNSRTGKATCPSIAYGWYLQRMRDTIDEAYVKGGGKERVLVLAHSAGGWLARAAMANGLWRPAEEGILLPDKGRYTADRICCLATMGGLHKSPVNAFPFFTRGAIVHTNSLYPGAFLKQDGVGYVSIGSDGILGCDKSNKAAFTSYNLVCGQGDVVGDGVIPYDWTQLDGARQIKLEGILHSFSALSTPNDQWYGADAAIDEWLPAVLEEAGLSP